MLPPPALPTKGKGKEHDMSSVERHIINLTENESDDITSTSTEQEASTLPPASTTNDASSAQPVPTLKDPGTTFLARTGKEPGTTPDKPTDFRPKGSWKPERPATPGCTSSSSNDDDTADEEYVSCFLE
jgi:hypothetical protein